MFCNNCGKEIADNAFICPHCGVKTGHTVQDDGPLGCLGVVCFLFPIVGLILYLVWKDDKPNKSRSAGKLALWGFIIGVVLWVLYLIIIVASASSAVGNYY